MTFEVKKNVFERGLILLSSDSNVVSMTKLPKQYEWLEEISFDLTEDADDYLGKYFEKDLWEKPVLDNIVDFFQTTTENSETRIENYEVDLYLTKEEKKQFKDFITDRLLESPDHPGIFTGTIHCEQNSIIIFTSRSGFSWSDYDADLLGIYNDIDEGKKELFNLDDGIFI